MSYFEQVKRFTLPAGADISAHQYKFATLDSSGRAILNTTTGGPCIGVIADNDADAVGRRVAIAYSGIMKVEAAGAVAVGANVQSDNAGLATAAAAGDYSQGIALEAAAAAGDIIAVLLRPQAQINA